MTASHIKRGAIVRLTGSQHAYRVTKVSEGDDGRLTFALKWSPDHKPILRHARPDRPLMNVGWLKSMTLPSGKQWQRGQE